MNNKVTIVVIVIIILIILCWPRPVPRKVIGEIKNNLLPNMCLGIEGSSKDIGKFAYINRCDGSGSKIWEIDDKSRLINKNSGLCLESSQSKISTEFQPHQRVCGDNPEQKWTLEEGRLANNGKFIQTAIGSLNEKGIPVVLSDFSEHPELIGRLDQVWSF
jgi:hypothetical protein